MYKYTRVSVVAVPSLAIIGKPLVFTITFFSTLKAFCRIIGTKNILYEYMSANRNFYDFSTASSMHCAHG